MSGFYDIAVAKIDGTPDLLGGLHGKVTLAVNVASRCGLTPQYEGLEQLQRDLAAENFTVVGFPCNQFAGQEPGSAEEIVEFCRTSYGVSFPVEREARGQRRAAPSRCTATSPRPGTGIDGDITWNFEKFLIGRDGNVLQALPADREARGPRPHAGHRRGALKAGAAQRRARMSACG